MYIAELFKRGKCVISCEIFPPKKSDGITGVLQTVKTLAGLNPGFISVTYGAGGSGALGDITADLAGEVSKAGAIPLAHITAQAADDSDISVTTGKFKARDIKNILVLRGDEVKNGKYQYAKDLLNDLKDKGFCLGAAAYPEGHISVEDPYRCINHLRQKQDAGAEFFITQLFFSNDIFYRFRDRAGSAGITVPISAGIMPILSKAQIARMIFMCGASLPAPIIKLINRYGEEGDSLAKAGVDYALCQMQDLKSNGAAGIHIYTMNKPRIAEHCMAKL